MKWTKEKIEIFWAMKDRGCSLKEIATAVGCTYSAIQSKSHDLLSRPKVYEETAILPNDIKDAIAEERSEDTHSVEDIVYEDVLTDDEPEITTETETETITETKENSTMSKLNESINRAMKILDSINIEVSEFNVAMDKNAQIIRIAGVDEDGSEVAIEMRRK